MNGLWLITEGHETIFGDLGPNYIAPPATLKDHGNLIGVRVKTKRGYERTYHAKMTVRAPIVFEVSLAAHQTFDAGKTKELSVEVEEETGSVELLWQKDGHLIIEKKGKIEISQEIVGKRLKSTLKIIEADGSDEGLYTALAISSTGPS